MRCAGRCICFPVVLSRCFNGPRKRPTISGRFFMAKSSSSPFTVLDRKVYAEGANIFRNGELGSRAFIVEDGEVEIWRDEDGKRRRLGIVHKGGVFGEMALIDDEPRMANANALTKTVCIIVPGDSFKDKINRANPFIAALLRVFVQNIRSTVVHRRASDRK